MFPTHILSPPIIYKHILCVYSFPAYYITFIPLRTSMAMPPLRPDLRRSSNTWYPGISSLVVDAVSHVSWIHSTSSRWSSVNIYTFRRLIPAILMLPTFNPVFSHLVIRSFFFYFSLAEPFVRFPDLCLWGFLCSSLLFPFPIYYDAHALSWFPFPWLFIIIGSFAALAHWGASPFPTPAGLWPGDW